MSPKLAAMLRALDVDVKALRDELPQNAQDVVIFQHLKGREITVVGPDTSQLTRRHEAAALKAAGISALYLGPFWSKLDLWEQAAWLVRHWPKIDGYISVATKGTVAEVQQRGRIRGKAV
jgi:hypothetical protein